MAGLHWLCLFLLLVSASPLKHPLTDLPDPLEAVDTTFHFPGHEDLKFPTGEPLTVLCHIQNNAEKAINVTAVMGSLNIAFMFQQHVQNFSYKPFGVVIKADEEITLQYEFEVRKDLDVSQEYALAHSVFYESEGKQRFANTFFNQTIELYSPESDFETAAVFDLIKIVFTTVVIVLLCLGACFPDNKQVINARSAIQKTTFFKSFTAGSFDFNESPGKKSFKKN